MYHYTCILSLIIALPNALIAMNQTQTSPTERPFLIIHDYQIRALIEKTTQNYTPFQNYQKLLDALLTSPQITAAHFKSMENISLSMLSALRDIKSSPVALNYFEEKFTIVLEAILGLSAIQVPKNYVAESTFNENLACTASSGMAEGISVLTANNGIITLNPLLEKLAATLAKAMNPRTLLDHLNAHKYNITTPTPPSLNNIFKPQWFVVISLDGTTNTQAAIKIVVKPYADYQKPGTQTHNPDNEVEELAKVFDATSLNDSNRQQPITSLQTIAPSTSSTTLPTTPTTSIIPPPASITPATSIALVPAGAPATQIQPATPATNSQPVGYLSKFTSTVGSYLPGNPFARSSTPAPSLPEKPSTTPTSQTNISSESSSSSSSSSSSPTPASILPGPTTLQSPTPTPTPNPTNQPPTDSSTKRTETAQSEATEDKASTPPTKILTATTPVSTPTAPPSSVATPSNSNNTTPSTSTSSSASSSSSPAPTPNPIVKQEVHVAAPLPDSSVNDVAIVEKQTSKKDSNTSLFSAPPPSDDEKITTTPPPAFTSTPPTSVVYATPTSQKKLVQNSTSDDTLPISLISQSSNQSALSSSGPLSPDNDSGPATSSPAAKSPYSELQDSLQNSDLAFNQDVQEVRAKLNALSLEQPRKTATPEIRSRAKSTDQSSNPELLIETDEGNVDKHSQDQSTVPTSPKVSLKASLPSSKATTPQNRSRSNSKDQVLTREKEVSEQNPNEVSHEPSTSNKQESLIINPTLIKPDEEKIKEKDRSPTLTEKATETDKGKVYEQSQKQPTPPTSPKESPKSSPPPSKTSTPQIRSRAKSTDQSSNPELLIETDEGNVDKHSQDQSTVPTSPKVSLKASLPSSKATTPQNRSRSNSKDQSSTQEEEMLKQNLNKTTHDSSTSNIQEPPVAAPATQDEEKMKEKDKSPTLAEKASVIISNFSTGWWN